MMAVGSDENRNSERSQDKLVAGKTEPAATHWLVSGAIVWHSRGP